MIRRQYVKAALLRPMPLPDKRRCKARDQSA
jgi:hypothetical protein